MQRQMQRPPRLQDVQERAVERIKFHNGGWVSAELLARELRDLHAPPALIVSALEKARRFKNMPLGVRIRQGDHLFKWTGDKPHDGKLTASVAETAATHVKEKTSPEAGLLKDALENGTWVTVAAAAEFLGVTKGRVDQLWAANRIASKKVGVRRYVHQADVRKYKATRHPGKSLAGRKNKKNKMQAVAALLDAPQQAAPPPQTAEPPIPIVQQDGPAITLATLQPETRGRMLRAASMLKVPFVALVEQACSEFLTSMDA